MARTQIAFRLDTEKASQFKQRVEAEGRSLNVVLETLVDAYLEGKLTPDSNELTEAGNGAIAQLTERIDQLEKQLAPVIELLTLNQPRTTLSSANNKTTSVNKQANDSNQANSELPSVNISSQWGSANNELASVSKHLHDSKQANNELTPDSISPQPEFSNTELTDVNNYQGAETSKETDTEKPETQSSVNNELASSNNQRSAHPVNRESTSANTPPQLETVNNKQTSVSKQNRNSQQANSELTSGSTPSQLELGNKQLTSANQIHEDNTKLADVNSYSEKKTPSKSLPESKQEENEDVTPSKQSETPQQTNVTEQFQDSRDNSDRANEPTPTESAQDSDGGLSGWLSHGQMRQWLAERGQEIGHRSLWKAAKKASSEGEKFTFKNMEFRQRTDEKRRQQYCCVSLEAS